jgi:hypothetical protein
MPAAWIGAGAAVLNATGSLGSGAANVAGGVLAPQEAAQLAQMVNPFGQYNQQYASQLAGAVNTGQFGNGNSNQNNQQNAFTAMNTQGLVSSLNGQGIGQQINNLVSDPSSIYSTPQYQAAFGQGQNAVNATLAAQGLNASGNQLAALQSYGQTFGQNAYNTQLSQLSGLYGQALGANQQQYSQYANNTAQQQATNQQGFNQLAALSGLSTGSPQAAAGILSQGFASGGQMIGQGIGQLANGAGALLNGLGGSSSGGFSTGQGTTTGGFGNVGGSGALFGTSAGLGGDGFTAGGAGNTFGFTE